MRTWQSWIGASLGMVIAVVLCVVFVDRPLAHAWFQLESVRMVLAATPAEIPVLIYMAGVAVVLTLGHDRLRKPASQFIIVNAIAAVALIASAVLTKYALKPFFGRLVPSEFLYRGRYGFHWLQTGRDISCFPSSHSSQAAAALSVYWVFYARWRWAYLAAFLLLLVLLTLGEWHYLSDVIAGGYVGTVVAAVTIATWRAYSNRGRLERKGHL